jgi:hypothetical protein
MAARALLNLVLLAADMSLGKRDLFSVLECTEPFLFPNFVIVAVVCTIPQYMIDSVAISALNVCL